MKNLLTLLAVIFCSVGAFGQGAQYRPTPFANGFVQTVTSTGTAQTYLGIGSSTNNALLSGTNVFTGTNTFTAARFFPANNIGMRLLWSSPTNIFIESAAVSASLNLTNQGDFASGTYMGIANIPPLLGANSSIIIQTTTLRTNNNSSIGYVHCYAGPSTNFVGYANMASPTAGIGGGAPIGLLQNANSFTNQIQSTTFSNVGIWQATNFFDSSISNTLYFSLVTQTSHTNAFFFGFRLYELYAP